MVPKLIHLIHANRPPSAELSSPSYHSGTGTWSPERVMYHTHLNGLARLTDNNPLCFGRLWETLKSYLLADQLKRPAIGPPASQRWWIVIVTEWLGGGTSDSKLKFQALLSWAPRKANGSEFNVRITVMMSTPTHTNTYQHIAWRIWPTVTWQLVYISLLACFSLLVLHPIMGELCAFCVNWRWTPNPASASALAASPAFNAHTHTSLPNVYFPIQRSSHKHDLPSYHTYSPDIKSNKMRNGTFQMPRRSTAHHYSKHSTTQDYSSN